MKRAKYLYGSASRVVRFKKFFIFINKKIEREKENAIGISIALIMLGTGIASLSAALPVHKEVSMIILMTTTTLAMGANVTVLSQQSFKVIVWAFLINIIVNSFLIIYQLLHL